MEVNGYLQDQDIPLREARRAVMALDYAPDLHTSGEDVKEMLVSKFGYSEIQAERVVQELGRTPQEANEYRIE